MRPNIKRKRLGELFERQQTATLEEVVKAYHGEEELEVMVEKARKIDRSKWAKEFKDKYGTSPISFESALKAKAKVLADAGVMQLAKDKIIVENVTDPSDQFKAGIRISSKADDAAFQEILSGFPVLNELDSKELFRKTVNKNTKNLRKILNILHPAQQRKVENFIAAQSNMAAGMFDFEIKSTGTYAK
jgi:hypothetical protein